MPPKHTVRYLPVAERDLLSIHDWIATDSPSRALTFVDKLDARIGRLQIHPHLGRIPRHPKLRDYRVLVIDSYLVFSNSVAARLKFIGSFTALATLMIYCERQQARSPN